MAIPDARKQFAPLESNPRVFNSMLHALGASRRLSFHDVLSISDPDLLALIPRPVYALVLILPFRLERYQRMKAADEADRAVQKERYVGDESDDHVCFIRQTIHNACSLWSILHAVCNGEARRYIEPNTPLTHILSLPPLSRADHIATAPEIDSLYRDAAALCDSADFPDISRHPDYGYVCFVPSENGWLWEMDGERTAPARRQKLFDLLPDRRFRRRRCRSQEDRQDQEDQGDRQQQQQQQQEEEEEEESVEVIDLLDGPEVLDRIREYMMDGSDKASHFGLMALVDEERWS